jgi:hypothetical protein
MRSVHWMPLAVMLLIGATGCGASNNGSTSPAAPSQTAAAKDAGDAAGSGQNQGTGAAAGGKHASHTKAAQIPLAQTNTPEKAVAVFLEAVRKGDDERAAGMFTPLAREKAAGMGIQVAPKGSDTASFQVGKVDYLAEDGARVQTKWTDVDKDNSQRTDEITWMVRKETEGWRVAGMATVVFEGKPPLLLDFENPQETMQKLELLRREMESQAQPETASAQEPQTGTAAAAPVQSTQPQAGTAIPSDKAGLQSVPATQQNGQDPSSRDAQQTQSPEKLGNPFRR